MVAILNASAIAIFSFDLLACVSGHRTVRFTVTAIVPTQGRALHRNGVRMTRPPALRGICITAGLCTQVPDCCVPKQIDTVADVHVVKAYHITLALSLHFSELVILRSITRR